MKQLLTEIGEQPAMRHYDIANRTRNRFTGQVDVTPNEAWTRQRVARDRHRRLRRQLLRPAGVVVPHLHRWRPTSSGRTAWARAASYDYERYCRAAAVPVGQPRPGAGPGDRPESRLDGRLRGTRPLFLDLS